MKPEPTSPHTVETPAASGEAAASAYIALELPKARKALKRARIIGVVLLCAVGGYITAITLTMTKFFQPQEAAQVASGILVQHIDSAGPALGMTIERRIPLLIRQAPDYVLRQLPAYRLEAEKTIETEFQTYCDSFSKDLGSQIDKLFDDHKADLKTLLENANDRAALRKTLPDFEQVITHFLNADSEGRLIGKHVTEMAAELKEIEKRMDRLANGTNLTPEEQTARRSLAMLAKAIRDNTRMPEVTASSTPSPAKVAARH